MNMVNVLFVLILGALIVGAIYFIKYNASSSKKIDYPFFVSTRDVTTNIRSGPSLDYPIIWVYSKKNIPLKIIDNNNQWYQLEDIDGKKGWIYSNLTSNIKTVITTKEALIYVLPQENSKIIAIFKSNNILKVKKCLKGIRSFCKIEINLEDNRKINGWVSKFNVWGYVGE